jgi:hypothetical protein
LSRALASLDSSSAGSALSTSLMGTTRAPNTLHSTGTQHRSVLLSADIGWLQMLKVNVLHHGEYLLQPTYYWHS